MQIKAPRIKIKVGMGRCMATKIGAVVTHSLTFIHGGKQYYFLPLHEEKCCWIVRQSHMWDRGCRWE